MTSLAKLDDEIAVEARSVIEDLLAVSAIIMEGIGYGLSNESWDRAQYVLGLLDTRAGLVRRNSNRKGSTAS